MYNSNKTPLLVVAALLAVSAPLYFARGIGIFDDSLYLKAGQLILDGLVPYRDFYDIKPPGIYYLSAAIAAVGGRGWLAPRIFLFVFAAVFQVVLVRWIQRHFDTRAATIAAILIGLSYPMCQGYSLHPEPFAALATFIACALLLAGAPSLGRWAAAGALLALATIFKQTGLLYVAAFVVFAVFDTRRRHQGFSAFAATLTSLTAGFLVVVAPLGLAFAAQGLGPDLFDAVFTGGMNRALGALAPAATTAVTWLLCPAFITFVILAVPLVGLPTTRTAMDGKRSRAFILFACVGLFALLPTLKTNLVGHYMQPGAFAFSAACALCLDGYLRTAPTWPSRLVSGALIAVAAGYFVGVCGGSALMLREHRLRNDLMLQRQLRQTLDARLDSNQPVLCISISSTARLYLMSGRRPFNHSLYFFPTIDDSFSLDDARRVLLDGGPASALVEIHPGVVRPELNDAELAALRLHYEIIPVGPQNDHRLLAFIRYQRHEPSKHT